MIAPDLQPGKVSGGPMTKADLVEKVTAQIARTAGPLISKKDCARVVDSFRDAVKAALAEQHNIEIRGFGTFKIRQRKTRMARNPRTGDPVEVAARPVPVFKPSKELRSLVAQSVRYEVAVARSEFHVTAEFPTAGKDTLLVSLPAWSPGNYEIQNYARYVHGFGAKNASGQALYWDRADKDTWRVATGRSDRVTVEFDYSSDTIDLSIARASQDFAQFLGTNLFMFEEGQWARPAEVRFRLPAGCQVTTALKGPTNGVYRAADYHELADAMTFVGRYSIDSLQTDGKWIRIAVWPASDYTPAVARNLRNGVAKMAPVQNRIMGEAPYDVYTVFFNVIHGPIDFGGGLEHSSSQSPIMTALGFAYPFGSLGELMYPLLSHEFFHLWNVKRIRPAEMWPYDYHAEQYTPLLWWSEGVTDYYADLTNLRAGLWTPTQFLDNAIANIQQVDDAPEPLSVEDGSEATWIHEVYVNSSQLYYPKGSLLGFL